jgi:hypothetical protein
MTDRCPQCITQKLTDKRKARRRWQITRAPEAKQTYNKLAKELKHLLSTHKYTGIHQYLENLSPHKDTNYSLCKTTRKLQQPQYSIIYRHEDYPTTRGPEQINKKLQLLSTTLARSFAPSLRKLATTKKKKTKSCKN